MMFSFHQSLPRVLNLQPRNHKKMRRFSSLITNANFTIDEAIQAVQDNNSTETLRLLSELRSDIANINGNVTNLIFSVAAQPP
jgi:hypothetical protein